MANPTIVVAQLSDEEMKKSIANLVATVKRATHTMLTDTNSTVDAMEKKLKSLGNLKIDSGGSADGGASKRAKAQNAETEAIKKNIAASDRQIKKNQEVAMSFDRKANAQQVAIRSANPSGIRNAEELQTMNIQLDLLRERLREARQQYSSFIALAAHATTTGDKGLFQFATDGVHRYEQEVRNLIPQIRTLQSGIRQMGDVIAPQGHIIQNYVNSLQKANPELAALNAQYKSGTSLLQQQKTEFEQNAQAQRNSTNQQKQSLDDMNAYIRQNIQREQERRDAIRQTGLAARETADQLIRSAHEQASAQGNSPITGIKELTVAVEQMRRAYFDMSASEKASPIGLALEADIKRANEAITVIRKYNQSLLGTQQNDAYKITNASTLESLRASLKVLTDQYNKLTVAELNAGKGDALIQHFQDTTRAAQILQRTLNRPVSLKAALAGDERTLDDIAYKMQQLQSYKRGLNLQTQSSEIRQVDIELNRLNNDLNKYMGTAQKASEGNLVLARSWNYMKNRLAFYFTVGASTAFVKNLIEVRSQYEMNERALGILINSAERGTKIFNELSQMALVSPYTLIELSNAAKQLTAYNIAAKDVVDTTRRLADMAAAVGIPIERLTYALGQIKAYGYLNSRDARMFLNAGIPIVQKLSEHYTTLEGRIVSVGDVYDRMKKKTIEYADVMSVINEMTDEGGKFFDFQAKMADTLKVQLANLTLAWNNMLNDIGAESQGILSWSIKALKELFSHWQQLNSIISTIVLSLGLAKAVQLLYNATIGKTVIALSKEIAATDSSTVAVMKNQLSKEKLTKAQAIWMLSMDRGNNVLRRTLVQMGLLTTAQTKWILSMGKLAPIVGLFTSIGVGIASVAKGMLALATNPASWLFVATAAFFEYQQIAARTKQINEDIINGAKEAAKNLGDFIDRNRSLYQSLYKWRGDGIVGFTSKSDKDYEKLWEEIRNQIESSSMAANHFLVELEKIDDVKVRVAKGWQIAKEIRNATEALQQLHEKSIEITHDQLWGALGEGLKEDLEDYIEQIETTEERIRDILLKRGISRETFDKANVNLGYAGKVLQNEYQEFLDELAPTIASTIKEFERLGLAPELTIEGLERIGDSIIKNEKLSETAAETFRITFEEQYKGAMRLSLAMQKFYARTPEEKRAWEERQEAFDRAWGNENKAAAKAFFTWVRNGYTHLFDGMTKEELENINLQDEKYKELWKNYESSFRKHHKAAYDALKDSIRDISTWQVNIPVYFKLFGDKESSLFDQWTKADKDLKEADEMVERLTKGLSKLTKGTDDYKKASEELATARADVADAIARGGLRKDTKNKGSKKDILGDALSKEVQLITDIRKRYEEYMKMGMNSTDALTKATDEYGRSLLNVKNVLAKFGITGLLGKDVAKMDMRTLVGNLRQMLSIAQAAGNTKGVEAIEKAIKSLNVDIAKIDYKKITDGLNNELNKLKEEYELSVALDAEPELGDTFASLFGINTDELPHTFEDLVKKAQKAVNDLFEKEGGFEKFGLESIDVEKLLDKKTFDEWVTALSKDASSDLIKSIENVRKYLVDSRRKDIEETAKEWSKLLEKYAEYEFKRKQIFDEYEKEMAIARKKNASEEILTAIANRRDSRLAELDLNEFMKTPEWITATGNLAGMSKKAIGLLIDEINEYKKTAKYLTPKEIRQLNKALKQLHVEQKKNSPFKAISNMLAEAKERMENFDDEIKKTEKTISDLESKKKGNIADGIADEETENKLKEAKKRLEELLKARENVGKLDATEWVSSINEVISAVQGAVKVVDDLVKAIGGVNNSDVDKVFSIITQAGQGAAMGAQIGGGWGAVVGGILGAATGIISSIANSYNEDINNAIKASEDRVKSLEIAYIDLDHAIKDAYGDAVIGAKRAAIANKELQLTELKRQLQLEKSRKAKDRDNDKIRDLQTQIRELEWDIRDTMNDIVNDILGISSVGDFAENLVSSMIEAFKNGEDYMKVFSESFDDMIDNMVMKAIASRVIGDLIQKVFDDIKERKVDSLAGGKVSGEDFLTGGMEKTKWVTATYDRSILDWITLLSELSAKGIKGAEESLAKAQKIYNDSLALTVNDVDDVRDLVNAGKDDVKSIFEAMMEAFGIKYGQNSDKTLSNLQQGIQSITEDTAGAIEAYLNGVSQQVYLHSELLTQIRDTLQGFDFDVQLGVMSQILLQLQSSYQTQNAIRSIMEGWTNASGMAVRVEMV